MLDSRMNLKQVIDTILDGFQIQLLDESTFRYQCNCNHDKVMRALISMGRDELYKLTQEENPIEVTCQFCDRIYNFKKEEILNILENV